MSTLQTPESFNKLLSQVFNANTTSQLALMAKNGGLTSLGIEKQNQERTKADKNSNDTAQMFANFTHEQATQYIADVRNDLNNFSLKLDQEQTALNKMAQDIEDNTITVNGKTVYFDKESGRYVYQDKEGEWQELESEEDIAEARAKHEGKGPMSTKQDKNRHARLQGEHNAALTFINSANARLNIIEQQLNNGEITPQQAAIQTQAIETQKHRHQQAYNNRQEQVKANPISKQEHEEQQVEKKDIAKAENSQTLTDELDDYGIPAPPTSTPQLT